MEKTVTASSYKEKLVDNFKVFELNLQEGDEHPVHKLRKEALAKFDAMGFPSRKHEEWKYTKIGKYLKNDFQPRVYFKQTEVDEDLLKQAEIPGLKSNKLVFINGFFDPTHSQIIEEDKFEFTNIAEALFGENDLLMKGMQNVIDREQDPFIWLNQAFLRDGALIRVKDNTVLEHPIYFVNIEVPADGNHFDNVRHIVEVGNNCELKIIANYLNHSGEDLNLANNFSQLFIGHNSNVEWYSMQYHMDGALHLGNFEVDVARDSNFTTFFFTTSGELIRNVSNIVLSGENSESRMYGLYSLDGKEHVDNRTLVDHAVPHCFSDELFKGILDDKSVGVFNGKIIVRPHAQKTNAYQHNPNLLLSDDATINAKPQLEIFADDVKCTHGATSGQLDKESLFYLRSRGLGKNDAKALLTYAFAADVISKVTIPELNSLLEKKVQGKLQIHD